MVVDFTDKNQFLSPEKMNYEIDLFKIFGKL